MLSGVDGMPNTRTRLMGQNFPMNPVSKAFLFLRVFTFAAAVPSLMRLKLARVASILETGRPTGSVDPDRAQKIAAYVETAILRGKPLVRSGCLTRGLTRYYFFRRAGMDVSLHFGMGRIGRNQELIGHCWLVKDGEPYLEREDPRPLYTEMALISRHDSRRLNRTAIGGPLTHS